jgi:hypothetical protein
VLVVRCFFDDLLMFRTGFPSSFDFRDHSINFFTLRWTLKKINTS